MFSCAMIINNLYAFQILVLSKNSILQSLQVLSNFNSYVVHTTHVSQYTVNLTGVQSYLVTINFIK